MASAIYPKWKQELMQGTANTSLTGTVKVTLVDAADYTYSTAHDFYDDVPAIARIGTAQTLASKTFVDGVFDAADPTFPSVTGDQFEAMVIFIDTGVESTSRVVAYIDNFTATTPNGGNITVTFDNGANRVFKL